MIMLGSTQEIGIYGKNQKSLSSADINQWTTGSPLGSMALPMLVPVYFTGSGCMRMPSIQFPSVIPPAQHTLQLPPVYTSNPSTHLTHPDSSNQHNYGILLSRAPKLCDLVVDLERDMHHGRKFWVGHTRVLIAHHTSHTPVFFHLQGQAQKVSVCMLAPPHNSSHIPQVRETCQRLYPCKYCTKPKSNNEILNLWITHIMRFVSGAFWKWFMRLLRIIMNQCILGFCHIFQK
jgi:hypothetical protein